MLSLTSVQISAFIGTFWWPFCRIMGAFMIMPFLGNNYIPVTVRILLAVSISALIAPLLPPVPQVDAISFQALILAVEQLLVGFMLALFLSIMIHVMTLFGAMMSMQMGLSMAVMNDPSSGGSNPLLGLWFMLYGTLLFLALDGHLVAIGVLVDSFKLWPIGMGVFELPLMSLIARFAWIFAAAFMLALPAILAMLVVNLTFGVLSRAAPSLNVFALGFPMSMLMGLLCVFFSFSGLPSRYSDLCLDALSAMYQFIGGAI
ncbi:flagellar biosynthetic protein FliR [Shewanella fidelis]|uniref:Flagellar biosynthetic protein FliR n=1 Tax=Shewanella fidelis TaxID=173509 RepID=A0AAW8NS43_9GAMM|nr:flagellar biosynthetic protein FliR [Shewanella fidelis]MDR8525938.1 flagellar biosynthetic protein FliR [Shewanella fidelis]MDW4813874.1 flagellar biosynthetic protein FliR [Shewanella fidelis]MDW4817934.1 flagellar biosynthetic protein FliR [Shewanella fidelis]MDW4822001.1 flagellar biosynthetic protein FliR [Shewanella fidelis]MDW4826166.1 flagellar biosynthetic protein FliR [Shewanella fidelis]